MAKRQIIIPLLAIFLLGAGLRLYRLSHVPSALNWDEVSHAFNAYSLLITGADQWGQKLPVSNFRAYGDYPAALNLYFTVPSVWLFGVTDFAARFPHALIGSLSILTVFAAAYYWKRSWKLALLAGLFVAFEPWTFLPSRAIFQSNWTVILLSLGLALFLKRRLTLALVFWGLSLYAYHNTRIFVPLLVLPLLPVILRRWQTTLVFLLLFIPAVVFLALPSTRARSTWVGILDQGAVARIEEQRNSGSLPVSLSRLVYNRPVYLVFRAVSNYLGYFSPRFLFLSGGTQYQYSVPEFGVLNLINLPFFYLGILFLIKNLKSSKNQITNNRFLLWWLLLSPLPAAITRDQYAVIRATTMLPVVQLVAALGVMGVLGKFSLRVRPTLILTFIVFFCLFAVRYFYIYFTRYNRDYSRDWQYGYKIAVNYAKAKYAQYDKIIFTKYYGEPHEFVLWHWPWSPPVLLSDPAFAWDYHSDWYWVDGFDKFKFVNDWEIINFVNSPHPTEKYLIFSGPENIVPGTELTRINFLDGNPAFIIKEL